MDYSIQRFTRFQSVWHNVAEGKRIASKLAKLNDPQAAAQIKNRSLSDKLPDLKIASQRPESLISDIRHYQGIVELDISYGSIAPKTAEVVLKTLSNDPHYVVHHFNCIDQMALLNLTKIKLI